MLAEGGPIGQAQLVEAPARKTPQTCPTTPWRRSTPSPSERGPSPSRLPAKSPTGADPPLPARPCSKATEHDGFRLDTAHTPAQHAEAVDHRRMGIGAHESVRKSHHRAVFEPVRAHDGAQVLQVHLMHDAHARRHDPEVVETRFWAHLRTDSARGCAQIPAARWLKMPPECRKSPPAPSGQ